MTSPDLFVEGGNPNRLEGAAVARNVAVECFGDRAGIQFVGFDPLSVAIPVAGFHYKAFGADLVDLATKLESGWSRFITADHAFCETRLLGNPAEQCVGVEGLGGLGSVQSDLSANGVTAGMCVDAQKDDAGSFRHLGQTLFGHGGW